MKKKYDHVYWISEYDNKYSALQYVLLGLFLYNTKIKKNGIATIILVFCTSNNACNTAVLWTMVGRM